VLSIAPAETTSASLADFENVDDAEVAQLLLEVARVKWFDRPRDLDLPIFGEVQRTFLYMSKSYGARALRIYKQGGAVAICLVSGKRGKVAAEVCSWESVSRD
jgi:CspA family cold shock protein